MSHRSVASAALIALMISMGTVLAHNYIGLEHPSLVRVRVQSPNATLTDFPVPVPDTSLSIVCFRVRNNGLDDSRVTAVGFELPGDSTGFTLISPTETDFQLVEQVTHVPGMKGVVLDFALLTGRTFGGGRPTAGLAPSPTLTMFCVSGPFQQDVPIERLLDNGVVRVQRVGADGELGDVAVWENRRLP